MSEYSNGYLEHFGIRGMHWGVRKYQSTSGKFTEAGKKRYISDKTAPNKKDISSLKPYTKTGMKSKNKTVLSAKETRDVISGLEKVKKLQEEKYSKKWDKETEKIKSGKDVVSKLSKINNLLVSTIKIHDILNTVKSEEPYKTKQSLGTKNEDQLKFKKPIGTKE